MKKLLTALAAAFALSNACAAQADEMPMRGVCTKGPETQTFGFATNFNDVASETQQGTPEISLSEDNANTLLYPILPMYKRAPDTDIEGYYAERLAGAPVRIKRFEDGSYSVKVAIEHARTVVAALGRDNGWTCSLRSALPQP